MCDSLPSTVLGCLLDVSGSMREAVVVEDQGKQPMERLVAVLRAALELARVERARQAETLMFIGIFGLNTKMRCPDVVDLCCIIEAILDLRRSGDTRSGHDRLVEIANSQNRAYIEKYIRSKLTNEEAEVLHRHLEKYPDQIHDFVTAIPTEDENRQTRAAVRTLVVAGGAAIAIGASTVFGGPVGLAAGVGAFGGVFAGDPVADSTENAAVDSSEALRLARRVWDDWSHRFIDFEPRPIAEVIALLERIQEVDADGTCADVECHADGLLAALKRYLYGKTAMHEALRKAHEVFLRFPDQGSHSFTSRRQRILLVVSDGLWTDSKPIEIAQGMTASKDEKNKVTLAAIHITSEAQKVQCKLYDREESDWDKGQRALFQLASRIPCGLHPIPVLASIDWQLPSSNEAALYISLCSTTVLEEFCSALLSARFGSADALFDVIGRVQIDSIVDDAHVRTRSNPTNQFDSGTCYAHSIAAVVHMTLSRIYALQGGLPSVVQIRKRILDDFPENEDGWSVQEVLDKMIREGWYRPIFQYLKKGEDGARQALLHRRPVLATFSLSDPGWQKFSEHFTKKSTKTLALKNCDIGMHHSESPDGGHAVVLTGCDPHTLTFLNSWGRKWGVNGRFTVTDHTVLASSRGPMQFYDLWWHESDLFSSEVAAYHARVNAEVGRHASNYPTIFELGVTCPLCEKSSSIANFTGSIRQAICPRCRGPFKPEPGHLVRALYIRYGIKDVVRQTDVT